MSDDTNQVISPKVQLVDQVKTAHWLVDMFSSLMRKVKVS